MLYRFYAQGLRVVLCLALKINLRSIACRCMGAIPASNSTTWYKLIPCDMRIPLLKQQFSRQTGPATNVFVQRLYVTLYFVQTQSN